VDPLDPLVNSVRTASNATGTLLIGVAGSVGVGKTTFAETFASVLSAQTISTDGFLYPNAALEAQGLLDQKGFPESYDHRAIRSFVRALRTDDWPINVPKYSHELFDIVDDRQLEQSKIVIAEGINALQPPLRASLDVGIYLHAEEAVIAQWFVDRMLRFIDDAASTPGGFYDRFVSWDLERRTSFAQHVWDTVNLPNLRNHIAPTAANADWVVEFDAEHRIAKVREILAKT
jgi:type I pantothenate kinase